MLWPRSIGAQLRRLAGFRPGLVGERKGAAGLQAPTWALWLSLYESERAHVGNNAGYATAVSRALPSSASPAARSASTNASTIGSRSWATAARIVRDGAAPFSGRRTTPGCAPTVAIRGTI